MKQYAIIIAIIIGSIGLSIKDISLGTQKNYINHDSGWKTRDPIGTSVGFTQANIGGTTIGLNSPIKLGGGYDIIWKGIGEYTRPLIYYFTHYDLGDKRQTDDAPCIGASGQDLCRIQKSGTRTMALTVDIRKKLGIKFGDKVSLSGETGCEGVYTVTDEMACRFRGEYAWSNGTCTYSDGTPTPRTSHIKRPGTPYYIKGDLPGRPGGSCSITKL